jgi:hypothetical protein
MKDPIDVDRANAADDDCDNVPCPGAMLAGTLALMTAWADPCGNAACSAARQRHLTARKIVDYPQSYSPVRKDHLGRSRLPSLNCCSAV